MMAHGKVASPFMYRNRNSAPASKATQQPGAGTNAGSRQREVEFVARQRERTADARSRTTSTSVMQSMMALAHKLAESGQPHELLCARAIAAEVARMQSGA